MNGTNHAVCVITNSRFSLAVCLASPLFTAALRMLRSSARVYSVSCTLFIVRYFFHAAADCGSCAAQRSCSAYYTLECTLLQIARHEVKDVLRYACVPLSVLQSWERTLNRWHRQVISGMLGKSMSGPKGLESVFSKPPLGCKLQRERSPGTRHRCGGCSVARRFGIALC